MSFRKIDPFIIIQCTNVSGNSLHSDVYLTDINIANCTFVWSMFAWCPSFAHSFYFQPTCIILYLKWFSCRQYIGGSCFLIHSANICLFIGIVWLFRFNAIIYMLGFMSGILFFLFYVSSPCFQFSFSLVLVFLWVTWMLFRILSLFLYSVL